MTTAVTRETGFAATPFSVSASERMSALVHLVEDEREAATRREVRGVERRRERAGQVAAISAFSVGTGWAVYFAQLLLVR